MAGGLHFDLSAALPRERLDPAKGQIWADWVTEFGGVGGNLARHMHEVGANTHFLAVVGDDALGALLANQAASSLPGVGIEAIAVPDTATAIVALFHLRSQEHTSRFVIGPEHSAVDGLTLELLKSHLEKYSPDEWQLLLDGYMLRNRYSQWARGLSGLHDVGWQLNLELVPHNSWNDIDKDCLVRYLRFCRTISASMSTIERIIGLEPAAELGPIDRAHRFLARWELVDGYGSALILARMGHGDVEFCLAVGAEGGAELYSYDMALLSGRKSNQDRAYVYELAGRSALLGRRPVAGWDELAYRN